MILQQKCSASGFQGNEVTGRMMLQAVHVQVVSPQTSPPPPPPHWTCIGCLNTAQGLTTRILFPVSYTVGTDKESRAKCQLKAEASFQTNAGQTSDNSPPNHLF